MAALAVACNLCPDGHAARVLCYGLAFLMGAQNALASALTSTRVRATHLSGIITDLGVELSAWLRAGLSAAERAHLNEIMTLRLVTIAAFFLGGVAGAFAWTALGPLELGLPAAALAWIAWSASSDERA